MSIRKSNIRPEVASGNTPGMPKPASKPSKRRGAGRSSGRPKKDRRSLLEALEQRQLFAGPDLVGIQPNQGQLLFDGTELNTAPRELVFRFDDSSAIDPDTLNGIRITRAGNDGSFESAIATSDLGTGNQVLLEFRARQAGTAGEGLRVNFTTSSRVGSGAPVITVGDGVINIDLNSNPARPTQVRDLISAVDSHPVASQLLQVFSVSGATLFPLGTTVPTGTAVTLRGANAADATTDLGTGNAVRVRFISTQPGPEGRSTSVVLERANAGGPANPLVLVSGNQVTVRVNSNFGNETTVAELINAINSNPEASTLVNAVLEAGSAGTRVGNLTTFAQTILLTGANDIVLEPGYVGIGNSPNEVVFRFAEALPADTYQIDIFGAGPTALTNVDGEAFNDGENLGRQFTLNLGPKVAAVVPEPVRRQGNGALSPEVGVIDVHFNETMDLTTVQNPDFYQLIYTRDTASPLDDVVIKPTGVQYNQSTNVAKLTFSGPLARIPNPAGGGFLTGAARLRIGNAQSLPGVPETRNVGTEPGDSFDTAFNLLNLSAVNSSGVRAVRLQGNINNTTDFGLQFPGGPGAEGVRQIRPEDPSRVDRPVPLDFFRQGADSVNGITTIQYEFPSSFRGDDPSIAGPEIDNLKSYFNLITEQQKQRVREVLSLFSEYLGVQFVEVTNGPTSDAFFSIVVGDLYGADTSTTSGPGGLAVATRDRTGNGVNDLVVMDFQDFQQSTDDQFGGPFFRGAMLAIGQVIGFGFADSLPQPVTQSSDFIFNPGTTNEPTFPSVSDIVNGQFLYRPDSTDVDLYRFELNGTSKVSIQTIAERLSNASLLDTHLRLYREDPSTGVLSEVAQNDDYFSNDSLMELELPAGRYVVGVTASGNDTYNPDVPGSGLGGRSEGAYELRITTRANSNSGIRDASGELLDGDSDGVPGGIFDFWFVPADQSNTLFVDKAAIVTGNGSVAQPFRNLDAAINEANRRNALAATPGSGVLAVSAIRLVSNGGTDGMIETQTDNFSYQIGQSPTGSPLADGTTLDVPKGVQLVVDAGVIIKMRQARIGVGSTSPTVDRSNSAIQIMGTPILIGSNGLVARDEVGEAIPGNVTITSINDRTIGNGNVTGVVPQPQPGDWGGIDLRSDIDYANSTRRNRENEGVFLNHIQYADLRFGGGQVRIDGQSAVISPVDMALTRATVMNSVISRSADAAIAATPDTFRETRFDEAFFQQNAPFVSAIERVGPDIHGNTIIDNSINGMFVRVATRTGGILQPLTSSARFDDTDIVHVLTENLVVQGTPGGAIAPAQAPSSLLIQGLGLAGGGDIAPGNYVYRVSFSSPTSESAASTTTAPIEVLQTGQIRLNNLPTVAIGSGFTGRRLYRASVATDGTVGDFTFVGGLNATDTTFVDQAAAGTTALPVQALRLTARTDGRLAVDPGTVVKLGGARIDITFGADLIAEGTANDPVVFTSLQDQRYGAGGTFDTNQATNSDSIQAGDWGGIYVGHTSSATIDHAVIAGGGGAARIPGGFASFNVLEVHQAELRLANSRLEMNADGRGFIDGNQLDRAGRGENASGTVFVRGAQPVIANNDFLDGQGPVLTFDVNSMTWEENADPGRSTGMIDIVSSTGNSGPLVTGNRLTGNELNGMEIRSGQVATEIVWDDVDMVHVVRGMIEVPNHHVYGGLRLESDARGSLVVKFANSPPVAGTATTPPVPATTAGIVVGGNLTTAAEQFVDSPDRIGGSLQVVGHADFPVVLTSLLDNTIGAGFTPTGLPQTNTNNIPVQTGLPVGPEVNNGNLIDNDVTRTVPGFFEAGIGNGNEVNTSGVTVNDGTNILVAQDYVFRYSTFVQVNNVVTTLAASQITQQATLIADDTVESRGIFAGPNGDVQWIATSFFEDGQAVLFSNLVLNSLTGGALGDIRVISYLDQDVPPLSENILYTVGTPGEADFRAFTASNDSRVGFSHGGFYAEDGFNLAGAQYAGWAADIFADLATAIAAGTQTFSIGGVIDLVDLPPNNDLQVGQFFGPGDVTTAFAWDTNASSTTSRITSFLELFPEDPNRNDATPGSWNGLVIREAANDRNVLIASETESRTNSRFDSNAVPSQAQYLGELAPNEASGDENRRLGFIADGSILTNSDVDVYSFIAEAGTQVWFDIDRTQLGLNSVLELVDTNGNTLVLSDSSLLELRGDIARLVPTGSLFDSTNARALNVLPIAAGSPVSAFQDSYSVNPNDPGMRITLPGSPGQRNLYHVRVRSSNVQGNDRSSLLDTSQLRGGLSSGNYQLQIRLRETDETPGTQVRHADVRFATNGVQIIGGPINGPLVGDVSETTAPNDTIANAQPMGLFDIPINAALNAIEGPLGSNRLSKSVAGFISSATDVDWFRFDVQYERLTRDDASLFFASIFDIDYADGFARGDLAVYVFNEAGELVLVGTDSNIADDQPTGADGTDNSDLSRGSAGTLDPFIGVAELTEGRYFIAIANQSQIPSQLDQFRLTAATNPLVRLEPVDSIVRIAEDRIGGTERSVSTAPIVPTLFDPAIAAVPYTMNDVVMYTITGGAVNINNPFTGNGLGNIGFTNTSFQDFAFRANGELFGYTTPGTIGAADFDDSYGYFRISSENGSLTQVGLSGLETYHVSPILGTVVDSNDAFTVLGTTFANNGLGFAIGNRPFDRQLAPARIQNAYFQNILYAFSPTTGAFSGLGAPNRTTFTINNVNFDERANGAGTQIRERGYIETGVGENPDGTPRPRTSPQLVVPAATVVQNNGVTVPEIVDGSFFTLQSGAQAFRLEMDSGTMMQFQVDPANGIFPRESIGLNQPVRFSLTAGGVATIYELDSGPVVVIDSAQVVDGAYVEVTNQAGTTQRFEFNSNGIVNTVGAIGVDFLVGQTSNQLAQALAAAISASSLGVSGFATPGQGRVDMTGDSTTTPPVVAGAGLSVTGAAGSADPNVVVIPIRENFTANELATAVAEATGGAVAGNRVNYRNVSAANLTVLTTLGVATQTGTPGVTTGSTAVPFLVTDSAETVALRISQVVNANPTFQASGINVTVNGRNLIFENALLNAGNGTVSPEFTVAGVPPGGIVTGISMVGSTLYAVSDAGGLYSVAAPTATVEGQIGTYIATSTDLVGLNFTGLTTGPTNIPGLLDQAGNPLLFGTTGAGRLYAFDILGRLQPVFAGGATSVPVGAGIRGVEFSTLDFNLWHTTNSRGTDLGHGIGVPYNDTSIVPNRVDGGTSFYFGAEPLDGRFDLSPAQNPFSSPRLDGQGVQSTYNFPGGAKGALESAAFDLVGYSSADLPTLYFNYFLETDGVDGVIQSDIDGTFGRDQDAFRVYVIGEDGVQHLLTTNNSARAAGTGFNDEFDDPTLATAPLLSQVYDDDITVNVQPVFDNSGTWRQARVSLADFAGQRNLQLRIEFATGGAFSDGSFGVRAVPAATLVDGAQFVVGGQAFEIDLGATLTVPAGSQIANYYAQSPADPTRRVTVNVGGETYVLNDGTRIVNPGEVNVQLVQPGDGPLTTFTAEMVASRLSAAILATGLQAQSVPFDFSGGETNDELYNATRMPAFTGNVVFTGQGEFQTGLDVDLHRINVPAGATLRATLGPLGASFQSNVRIFDTAGNQLAFGTSSVDYTADVARTVVVGFSSGANNNYNPSVAGSGDPGTAGLYTATIGVTLGLDVVQTGARLQIAGGVTASPGADGLVAVAGAPGTTGTSSIPIVMNASMSAAEVAVAIQRAVADRFSGGLISAFPIVGNQVSLIGLTVDDNGPFALTGVTSGDFFGSNGPQRARANNFEGVYLDDFIIGFAERGEMVSDSTNVSDFIVDPLLPIGATARPTTGSYQLEIRDGSEYIDSLVGEAFRGFNTNDRLATGSVITALPAGQIVDGATFQITDGVSTITFEMDLVDANGNSSGVTAGRVRVPLVSPASLLPGRDGSAEVAAAIATAINGSQVRDLIDIVAVATDGVDTRGNSTLNLFGEIVVLNSANVLQSVNTLTQRGDKNRDRTGQGVIIVENSRFSFNSLSGIELNRAATVDAGAGDNPTVLTYPRNLVELNTQNQIPGVVIQSNVVAYNGQSGISITGLATPNTLNSPVAFDRIINNTIVGGFVTEPDAVEPGNFGGTFFPAGAISFADRVVAFTAGTGVTPGFDNASRALGAPDLNARGAEPDTGQFTTSLGRSGVLTLAFDNNFLTGSGDARPDLVIFETGEIESVRVEISRDGVTFFNVGVVGGIDNTVDIDSFGFGLQDRFGFVRLTDLRQGSLTSGPVGADIDAVGAISSVPADQYTAGGVGIRVRQNAAPTLLNNVIANSAVGLVVDATSVQSVVGGTTFYRNTTNATNPQANPLGVFNQILSPSLELFVDPVNSSFVPRAGVPVIDSSIDSLEDRSGLRTVKNAIGLTSSPIIAPRLDVNGQLRVDDPAVQSPVGIGESVFKDRGAEERSDNDGPRAVLISPRADEIGADAGVTTTRGTIFDSFDIQLIDGIAPVDSTPGVGIYDPSVTSNSVLVTKDGVPLVEGLDYRFGYDASNNVIRITPIAGIWEDNSVYVVRLLDATDALLQLGAGSTFTDGSTTSVLTSTGQFVNFEVETGISIDVDTRPAFGVIDGQGFTIFDGFFAQAFELDNNGGTLGGRVPVIVPTNATSAQIATALATAINQAGMSVTARVSGTRLQLLGPSTLTTVTPLIATPQIFTIAGQIGTSVGFGIGIPSENGLLSSSVFDGQTFTIQRGANLVRTFELDFGNGIVTPNAIRVNVGPNPTINSIADELVRMIGGAGLGLAPVNVGQGRVTLGGDANYALNLTNSGLTQLGIAGQDAATPIVIPVDATPQQVVAIYQAVIVGANLPGVSVAIIGDRMILNGVAAISGSGTVASPVIRDQVGNLLQSNRDTGRTELTVFVGGGFNFGNAPAPYPSLLSDDGPRHRVEQGFSFGPAVGPDADAVIPSGSTNDGVFQIGTVSPGFPAQFSINVTADSRPFYVDAWIDWDRDGVFEASEVTRYKSPTAPGAFPVVGQGTTTVSIQVPAGTPAGTTWARFRLSEPLQVSPGVFRQLGPTGEVESGEVEDIPVLVQANPYQNPSNPFDVNKSGEVTPLDALNVLNLLADYMRGGGVGGAIPLNPPPAFLTDLINGRFLPDVDGSGAVEPMDALAVINEIARLRRAGLGEGEAVSTFASASNYVAVADGVMASPLTLMTDLSSSYIAPEVIAPQVSVATAKVNQASIFDSPDVTALDDVIDDIASEGRQSTGGENDSIDAVFAGLGLGL